VSDAGDSRIDDHLSELRHGKGRDHANGRLPVLLWMQRLRLAVASEARRLLRVLFLRVGFLPRRFNNSKGAATNHCAQWEVKK